MVRPIVLFGDPMLRLISTEVQKNSKIPIEPLLVDMFETVKKANGAGLAAIQVGVPLRIFVVDANLEKEDFHFKQSFINPKILKEWGEPEKHPEGCLSIPQLTAMISRLPNIEFEWYDEEWVYHKEEFSGYAARIIQHEYEHLNGGLYVDELDLMWSEMFKIPLDLIEKRKIKLPYLWR